MDLVVTLIVLTVFCTFLTWKGKLNVTVTPFVSLSAIILFLAVAGVCDLLVPGVIAIYVCAFLCLLYLVVKERGHWKEILVQVFRPGFVFFLAVTVFFWFVLQSKQAGFRIWDEFSFWGTACKVVFEEKRLYTMVETSMINVSYPPDLALNSMFLQFLTPYFTEWKAYVAYDILAMAAVTPLFSRLEWKNIVGVLAAAGLSYFAIYEFFYSLDGLIAYASSYADWIVGYCFAGALLVWYCAGNKGKSRFWATIVSLMMVPLIRDIGLALGLVAAGILCIDMLVGDGSPSSVRLGKRNWVMDGVAFVILMACVPAVYVMWALHFKAAVHMDRVTIPYPYSAVQMLLGQDPHCNEIWHNMVKAFDSRQLVNFGTPKDMVVVFTAIAVLLVVLAKEKKNKFRILCFAVLHLFGFAAYYLFQTYAYAAIFASDSGLELICFERYVSSYFFGWYFSLIGLAASEVAEPYDLTKLPEFLRSRWKILPGVLVTVLALWSVFHYLPFPMKTLSITSDYVDLQEPALMQLAKQNQRKYRSILTEGTRIYVIAQNSSGGEWFLCNYTFIPAYTVKTMGGGNFASKEMIDTMTDDPYHRYMVVATKENFAQFLRENDVDLLYLFNLNDYFYEEFADMFADHLDERSDGSCYFYAVHDLGDSMEFVGIYSSDHYRELRQEWGLG
ncbi:MAG: hypothetical protein IJ091_07215 [Oscillospiraceae bacterium]|nr:hypothetical protein [Oscillospiraceae bacterium]